MGKSSLPFILKHTADQSSLLESQNSANLAMDITTGARYNYLDNATDSNIYCNYTTCNITALDYEQFDNASSTTYSGPSDELRFICETMISMPVALLGILGNILAFFILLRQRQRLSTTLLLQGLAVVDTLVLLANVLLRSIRYLYVYTQASWLVPFNTAYPYIFVWGYPVIYFLRLADSLLTVLLTIDRFIAVRCPLQAQTLCTLSKSIRNMVILAVASFLFSLPRFFEHKVDHKNSHGFSATYLLKNEYYTIIYRIVLYLLIMYFIPMLLLVFLNAKLLNTLREADTYRANVSEWRMKRANRNITIVVITVVLVTIICNSTAMVTHLIWSLQLAFPSLKHMETTRRYLALVSNILVTINSAINFIIYCLCSRNFTVVLSRMCRCYTLRMRLKNGNKQQTSSNRTTYVSLAHNSMLKRRNNVPLILQHGV